MCITLPFLGRAVVLNQPVVSRTSANNKPQSFYISAMTISLNNGIFLFFFILFQHSNDSDGQFGANQKRKKHEVE